MMFRQIALCAVVVSSPAWAGSVSPTYAPGGHAIIPTAPTTAPATTYGPSPQPTYAPTYSSPGPTYAPGGHAIIPSYGAPPPSYVPPQQTYAPTYAPGGHAIIPTYNAPTANYGAPQQTYAPTYAPGGHAIIPNAASGSTTYNSATPKFSPSFNAGGQAANQPAPQYGRAGYYPSSSTASLPNIHSYNVGAPNVPAGSVGVIPPTTTRRLQFTPQTSSVAPTYSSAPAVTTQSGMSQAPTAASPNIQQGADTLRQQLIAKGVPQSDIDATMRAYYQGMGAKVPGQYTSTQQNSSPPPARPPITVAAPSSIGTTNNIDPSRLTRSLGPGASGNDVAALQSWLISNGYKISAGATGYYGPETQAAVSAWQKSSGVNVQGNYGYFGSISRSYIANNENGITAQRNGGLPTPNTLSGLSATAAKVGNTVAPEFKGVGQELAAWLGANGYQKDLGRLQKSDIDYLSLVIQRRNEARAAGLDTSHWDMLLSNYKPSINFVPSTSEVFPGVNHTPSEVIGNFGALGLDIVTSGAAGKGRTAIKGAEATADLAQKGNAARYLSTPSINITEDGLRHAIERHTINDIGEYAGKSKFNDGEDISLLIRQSAQTPATAEANGYYSRIYDVGRNIGFDGYTGIQTPFIKVITRPDGSLVTAYPVLE